MDLGLTGRVAIITGASYGLGQAMAECLVQEGAQVAICARGAEQLEQTAAKLGPKALAVQADVSKAADINALFEKTQERFGRVWHINCHSMPEMGDETTADGPVARPDFILGDRKGTTCDPALTEFARSVLEELGYNVVLNFPYAGVELVRAYSAPVESRHSLQVEVNRKLYMNEITFERNDGFETLRQHLVGFTRALSQEFARREG